MSSGKGGSRVNTTELAGIQAAQDVRTALAQQHLTNMRQVTPTGTLDFRSIPGAHIQVSDGQGGTISVPKYEAKQTLSAGQEAIRRQNESAELKTAQTYNESSGRLRSLLNTAFNYNGAPAAGNLSGFNNTQIRTAGGNPSYVGQSGVTKQNFQSQFDSGQPVQSALADAGQVQTGIDGTQFTQDYANPGNLSQSFGDAGDITRSIAGDGAINDVYDRSQQALLDRMNPQLDRRREQLETRLASQGIRIGSEAYQDAIGDHERATNDAQYGAIINAGAEASRAANIDSLRGNFANDAQSRQFAQLQNRAQFSNNALAQQSGLNRERAEFANRAGQAQFEQNQARGNFANQAQAQRFNEASARGQFANSAQQAQFDQNQAQGQFANNAKTAELQQDIARTNLQNQQQGLISQNALQRANFANQATNQQNNNVLSRFNAQNASRNQNISERTALRNQPINELAALIRGGGVASPNFITPSIAQLNSPNIGQFAALDQQSRAAQQQQSNSLIGGVLGFGANALGGLF